METSQVPYHTFAAFAFELGTICGVLMLVRDYVSNRGLRAKFMILWVLIASSYIIAFPTLLSAMTGYTSVLKPYVEDKNQNLVPWGKYTPITWIIEDGERIPGLGSRTLVTQFVTGDQYRLFDATYNWTFSFSPWSGEEQKSSANPLILAATKDGFAYIHATGHEHNISSTFNISAHSYLLDPPLLTITPVTRTYSYQKKLYDIAWISTHASCQPTGTTYR